MNMSRPVADQEGSEPLISTESLHMQSPMAQSKASCSITRCFNTYEFSKHTWLSMKPQVGITVLH
jgi:hypothetical protein